MSEPKTIHMEDVHSISLEAMSIVETRLREFGITLTPEQDDEIYIPLDNTIEKFAGYPDFAHEH